MVIFLFEWETVRVVYRLVAGFRALDRATRPDESTWTMDGERVVVTVAKMDEQVWHELEGLAE